MATRSRGSYSRRGGPVKLDQKTQERIVSLYRDHSVTITDLKTRFRVGENRLKAILAQAGVTIERHRYPYGEVVDA